MAHLHAGPPFGHLLRVLFAFVYMAYSSMHSADHRPLLTSRWNVQAGQRCFACLASDGSHAPDAHASEHLGDRLVGTDRHSLVQDSSCGLLGGGRGVNLQQAPIGEGPGLGVGHLGQRLSHLLFPPHHICLPLHPVYALQQLRPLHAHHTAAHCMHTNQLPTANSSAGSSILTMPQQSALYNGDKAA